MTLGLFVFAAAANAQTTLTNLAGEYALLGHVPGDQMGNQVAASLNGGWVVWYDNATDGDGFGISARRLNSNLSGDLSSFRVNEIGAGEQENPQVALLQEGGAAFVWQGGAVGFQDIFLRIVDANGVFQTDDVSVNTHVAQQQGNPSIVQLQNGNLLVAWASHGQDGSMQGIYARLFSSAGVPLTAEFAVNQETALNQRNPQVVSLADGRFVIAWASETVSNTGVTNGAGLGQSVGIVGRVFGVDGLSPTDEVNLSSLGNVCATPALASLSNGGFVVGWGQLDFVDATNGWDVFVRSFNSTLAPVGQPVKVNTYLLGDQIGIRLAAQEGGVFAAWTSQRQDSSHEGVFGRFLAGDGSLLGDEVRINTTTISKQMHPSIAAAGDSRFISVWSGFIGGAYSFDLFAQRFVSTDSIGQVYAPEAPYVNAIDSTHLSVTWPALAGFSVKAYEVYIDSNPTPVTTTNIHTILSDLLPGSSYSIRLLYELTDGRRSPLSNPSLARTWGPDANGDGVPDEWQIAAWGGNLSLWPATNVDSDGDGASNYAEFLAGTDPTNVHSVLRTRLSHSSQGLQFSWSTKPGFVYQVQAASTFGNWVSLGVPRFAHGTFDSIHLNAGNGSAFYRVIRLR